MKLEEYKKVYKEEYRDIKIGNGFDNYRISNYGNFCSKKRTKPAKPEISHNGYLQVRTKANSDDPISRKTGIHRLVALMFLEKPEGWDETWEVDHLDSDKTNNNPTNLEWVSPKENIKRSIINGDRKTKNDIEIIKKLCDFLCTENAKNETLESLSKKFNLEKEVVEGVYNRRQWRIVVSEYPKFVRLASNKSRDPKLIEEICNYISENKTLSNQKIADYFNSKYPNLLKPIGHTLISTIKNKKVYTDISDKYFKEPIKNSRNRKRN